MRKALIVVPTFAGVQARPFRSFLEIAMVAGRDPSWHYGFVAPERMTLPFAMNGAAAVVLQQGYDCLIAFDDDCFAPYDCIPRLLAHYDAGHPFVAGVGVMRGYPHTTTVAQVFEEGPTLLQQGSTVKVVGHQWLDDITAMGALEAVDFCGVPVAMIARSAFEQIPGPWFGLHADDGGSVTHDVFFCRKLKAAGIPVLVDTTIKCGHLAEAP
jgi:hypothetical protein